MPDRKLTIYSRKCPVCGTLHGEHKLLQEVQHADPLCPNCASIANKAQKVKTLNVPEMVLGYAR